MGRRPPFPPPLPLNPIQYALEACSPTIRLYAINVYSYPMLWITDHWVVGSPQLNPGTPVTGLILSPATGAKPMRLTNNLPNFVKSLSSFVILLFL